MAAALDARARQHLYRIAAFPDQLGLMLGQDPAVADRAGNAGRANITRGCGRAEDQRGETSAKRHGGTPDFGAAYVRPVVPLTHGNTPHFAEDRGYPDVGTDGRFNVVGVTRCQRVCAGRRPRSRRAVFDVRFKCEIPRMREAKRTICSGTSTSTNIRVGRWCGAGMERKRAGRTARNVSDLRSWPGSSRPGGLPGLFAVPTTSWQRIRRCAVLDDRRRPGRFVVEIDDAGKIPTPIP